MITRKDYMEGRATHHEYYMDVIDALRFKPRLPVDLATIRQKIAQDEHLNNIPLHLWDACAVSLQGADTALRERGDWLSPAGAVCILKAYAKHLAIFG